MDTADAGNTALIGDEAHIVAKSLGGPRGGDTMPVDDRDEYGNLILLCANHHREVDINLDKYTIDELLRIKAGHEEWVRESLAVYDQERQTDDEQASAYVDEWLDQADILNWSSWASSLLVPQPRMTAERDKKLFGLRKWLQSRIWPDRYPELKDAFLNFRIVLDDMQEEFRRHAERIDYRDGVVLVTRKFYQITEWDPDRYHRLFREYEFHVDLVGDLVLELTRAANFVSDQVRRYVFPGFRLEEGVILVDSGPYENLKYISHRVEYRGDERVNVPYPGVEEFKSVRLTRDHHIGRGQSPEGQQ